MSGCENVGICRWCGAETAGNHLCEQMCEAASIIVPLAARGQTALCGASAVNPHEKNQREEWIWESIA